MTKRGTSARSGADWRSIPPRSIQLKCRPEHERRFGREKIYEQFKCGKGQGDRIGGIRYLVQQARLRCRGAFWSPQYIQHSAHIEPGRDGLFNLIKAAPPSLKYEPGVVLAEGDYVILHGRFSNIGLPVNWIAADVVRLKDRILVEHWDVIQDEATEQQSKSGLPMFGDSFPK